MATSPKSSVRFFSVLHMSKVLPGRGHNIYPHYKKIINVRYMEGGKFTEDGRRNDTLEYSSLSSFQNPEKNNLWPLFIHNPYESSWICMEKLFKDHIQLFSLLISNE